MYSNTASEVFLIETITKGRFLWVLMIVFSHVICDVLRVDATVKNIVVCAD